MSQPINILVINPNSSKAMTEGMENAIKSLNLPDSIKTTTYTGPSSSPASIDNDEDIRASTTAVLADLDSNFSVNPKDYDGVLIACYSVHTLVDALTHRYHDHLPVTGIFEASLLAAQSLLPHTTATSSSDSSSSAGSSQWGIVTTGKFWEAHLTAGVRNFLGEATSSPPNLKFKGVISTGLNAGDFHHVSPEEVRAKLEGATKTLLGDDGRVSVVAMGCGGMAGLEEIIRSTAAKQYGDDKASLMYVVDGVKAGVLQLEQTIRSRKAFREAAAA